MGRTMGHYREGDDRGSVDRPEPHNAKVRRGTKTPPNTTNKGRRASRGKVISLSRRRRAGGFTRTPRAPSTDEQARHTVGHRRLWMVAAVFAVTGLLLGGRAVHISLTEDQNFRAFADEQSEGGVPVMAPTRGSIVSADGRELATSLEVARIIATPYQIEDPQGTARELDAVLGKETDATEKEIKASLLRRDAGGQLSGYSVVAEGIKPETAAKVQAKGIAGITTAPDTTRVYPDGTIASQLLGHQGDYGEPFGGVEASYDDTLKRGKDVSLTVDSAVQQELQQALKKAVEKSKAKSAVGVVMRVDDGSIVALANTPDYDISDSQPHETEILTPGGVLEHSSNVGATKIAQELGGKKLYHYMRAFGFGKPTGVDLWGEDPGIVPAYKDWSGISIGNIPFGQVFTVTPLQLVSGYATLVNGGRRVTPHVTEQATLQEQGPRVISKKTSAIVRGMLQGVVDDGSGHFAQISGYTVAGKTGTSQKVDPKTGTYGDQYVSSFIGFAPATDPEYVMLVAVDEPQTSYW